MFLDDILVVNSYFKEEYLKKLRTALNKVNYADIGLTLENVNSHTVKLIHSGSSNHAEV